MSLRLAAQPNGSQPMPTRARARGPGVAGSTAASCPAGPGLLSAGERSRVAEGAMQGGGVPGERADQEVALPVRLGRVDAEFGGGLEAEPGVVAGRVAGDGC